MSQANYTLILAPEALSDRADMYAYTERTWGEAQAERYSDKVQSALETIRSDPLIGRYVRYIIV